MPYSLPSIITTTDLQNLPQKLPLRSIIYTKILKYDENNGTGCVILCLPLILAQKRHKIDNIFTA